MNILATLKTLPHVRAIGTAFNRVVASKKNDTLAGEIEHRLAVQTLAIELVPAIEAFVGRDLVDDALVGPAAKEVTEAIEAVTEAVVALSVVVKDVLAKEEVQRLMDERRSRVH